VVVLEGYTREPWAIDMNSNTAATTWSSFQVHSVDGRNKLPGFVKYLRERQKTCFGRFVMDDNTNKNNNTNNTDNENKNENETSLTTFVWIISHKQTSSSRLSCRVAPIHSIPNCNLRPKAVPAGRNRTQNAASSTAVGAIPAANANANASVCKPKKKGFGLLGNLVGAQRRTNHQVVTASTASAASTARTTKTPTSETKHNQTSNNPTTDNNQTGGNHASDTLNDNNNNDIPLATSGQVLAGFRHEMEQKMLDFDISPEMSTKISVKIGDQTKKVRDPDKGNITMEVLKYIVYEQAEEVNEEWIAHQEPSEFTDEVTVAIYKDPEFAPQEVIEEMNHAEIPEEMKAQQKMIEQKGRQQEINARRVQEALQRQALRNLAESSGSGEGNGQSFSALNTDKRDLRTIEEIQQDNAKRRKME